MPTIFILAFYVKYTLYLFIYLEKNDELISKEATVYMLLITSVIKGIKHFFFRSDTHSG